MTDLNTILSALEQNPLVPVLTLRNVEDAKALGQKLYDDGITVVEATLRTEAALDSLVAMKAMLPELIIGMGTVTTPQDITNSVEAGADFIVTPATTPSLVAALKACPVPVFPAVATLSEALTLYQEGFEYQKLFPAEVVGGVKLLKSWGAPIPQIKFMPTGGIKDTTYQSYLDLPNVFAVGGSWMAK